MTEIKNKKITIKCTESELETIKDSAANNNMSLSEYIRARVLFDTQPKFTSFELKTLKGISVCAGFVQTFVNQKFTDQEFEEFEKETKRVMKLNGIAHSLIIPGDNDLIE